MSRHSNYIKPPRHRPWWSYAAAAVLVAGSAAAIHFTYVTRIATDAALVSLETKRARRTAAEPAKLTRAQLEQKNQWALLALERDFDWDSIFQALQNANNTDIELLEFRPEKRQRIIILRGEARSVTALSEYLRKVAVQPAFAQLYLTRQDLRAHGPLETVGFEIRATLRK